MRQKLLTLALLATLGVAAQVIRPTNPIVIPAIPERVADGMWIQSLTVEAPSPGALEAVSVMVTLLPFNTTTKEVFPGLARTMRIDNALGFAATNEVVAEALVKLKAAIQEVAGARGVID